MISDEIISHLEDAGIGTFKTDLFWSGFTSDAPDNAVAVYEYQGEPPTYTKLGPEWDYPRFQVVARSKDYSIAVAKAQVAYAALRNVKGATLGDGFYDYIRANSRPFQMPGPRDDGGRLRIVCNYRAKRRIA